MIETFCQDVFFFPELRAAKEQKAEIWAALSKTLEKGKKTFLFLSFNRVLLTGCWLIWPSGRSSVGSCHPVCVGGTQLPLSCPEPWPSSTYSRPHSCRCHCGHRSQPGCPANTQTKNNSQSWPFLQGKFPCKCTVKETKSKFISHPKLDVTAFFTIRADYSWSRNNIWFRRKH